eukprot:3253817-Pyramimonas_sp.AAC.1
MALHVNVMTPALSLEAPGPLAWPVAMSGRNVLDSSKNRMLPLVALQLLQLQGQIPCPFDLTPSCQHHLLDVAREVAARLL